MEILQAIKQHWLNDWHNDRKLFWIEFFGTIFSMTGTIVLAVFIRSNPILVVSCIWLISSSLIMIGAFRRNAIWLFVLMLFNTIMNIVGIVLLTV